MDKHLLHELVEKVLLFWVFAFGHHLFEVVEETPEHFLVNGRQLQPLPPGRTPLLLPFRFLQPIAQVPDLLVAEFRLKRSNSS